MYRERRIKFWRLVQIGDYITFLDRNENKMEEPPGRMVRVEDFLGKVVWSEGQPESVIVERQYRRSVYDPEPLLAYFAEGERPEDPKDRRRKAFFEACDYENVSSDDKKDYENVSSGNRENCPNSPKKYENVSSDGLPNKLTIETVREMRRRYKHYGWSMQRFAEIHNISLSCVEQIINNRIWKDETTLPRSGRDNRRRGCRHHNARFGWKEVGDIRQKVYEGAKKADVAREYDVTWRTIHNIVNNKTWRIPERNIKRRPASSSIKKAGKEAENESK